MKTLLVAFTLLSAGCTFPWSDEAGWPPVSWESFGKMYTNAVSVDYESIDAAGERMVTP